MATEWLLNVMMLAAEGLVLWLAYLVLRSGRVVPGMSRAEIRCLMGGFMVMCLAINVTTHWDDRMDTLRLFIPVWTTLGRPGVFRGAEKSKLTHPCLTQRLRTLHPPSFRLQKVR